MSSVRQKWVAVLRDYGGNFAEVGWSLGHSGVGRVRNRVTSEADWEKNQERNVRRARSRIRRKVLAAGFDRLLTLTQRETVTDVSEYHERLRKFIRLCQKRGYLRQYVGVFEYQKRGSLHVHLAIRGWVPVQVLRTLARRAGFDNVDISYRRHRGTRLSRLRIARYLAKYLSKDTVRTVGGHRYLSSKGIVVPEVRVECPSVAAVLSLLPRVGYVWVLPEAEGSLGWACSWG